MAKYARASHVTVSVGHVSGRATLTRFPTTASVARTPGLGTGLRGLADRVEALGGHLEDRQSSRARHPHPGRDSLPRIQGAPRNGAELAGSGT